MTSHHHCLPEGRTVNVYRIRHWSKYFENNKSRSVESCRYVCMPNKQDGVGLTRILSHPDGAAIFGVWCLILQACSRQPKRDGWLTDDGTEKGRPWDLEDLAMRWRRTVAEIERCLVVVCDPKIAWMEALPSKCPTSALLVSARCLEGKGREGKEGKGTDAPAARVVFAVVDEDRDEILNGHAEPERPPQDDPDTIATNLRSHVDCHARDPKREAENVVELAQLVGRYGLKPVQEAAAVIAHRERRKARVWELLAEIVAATHPALERQPKAGPADDQRTARAKAIVAKHGWQACAEAAGIPADAIRDDATMVEAMLSVGEAYDAVLAKLGGAA